MTVTLGQALTRLSAARGAGAKVDDITADVYVTNLADLDQDAVIRACLELCKEPREAYASALPSVGDIRKRALEVANADAARLAVLKLAPMPVSDDDPRTWEYCLTCHDEPAGWMPCWCPGVGALRDQDSRPYTDSDTRRTSVETCGRVRLTHGPHHFVDRCSCYGTNPVAAKKADAMRVKATPKPPSQRARRTDKREQPEQFR